MASFTLYIQCLESYLERSGARLLRASLPDCVHGRIYRDLITLRAGLSPEQELPALVHETAHWLAHSDPSTRLMPTLCEYEAEAVEQLVLARIGVPAHASGDDSYSPTDDLLSSSVARVRFASSRICGALGLSPD